MNRMTIATGGLQPGSLAYFRQLVATNGYWDKAATGAVEQFFKKSWLLYYWKLIMDR